MKTLPTSRLRQLVESRTQYYSPIRLSEDDLRYSIPESLVTIYDVERAIEIQKEAIKKALHNGYYSSDEIEELFTMMNTIDVADAVRDTIYEGIEIAA